MNQLNLAQRMDMIILELSIRANLRKNLKSVYEDIKNQKNLKFVKLLLKCMMEEDMKMLPAFLYLKQLLEKCI